MAGLPTGPGYSWLRHRGHMCLPPPAVGYQVCQHTVPSKAFPLPSTATIRGFPGPDSLLEGLCLLELDPGMVAFELMIQYFLTDQRCLYQPQMALWGRVKQHFKITEALGLDILVTPALGVTHLLLSCERSDVRGFQLATQLLIGEVPTLNAKPCY